MKTIRCSECNLVNWATAALCKRCQAVLQTAETVAAVETASVGAFQTVRNPVPANSFADLNNSNDFTYRESTFEPRPAQTSFRPAVNNYAPNNYYQPNYKPVNLKSGLAVASMIFGVLAFVTSIFLIGILFAPVGLILAIVALVKASKKPNEYAGKGFAITGLVTSALVLLILPVIAAIAIPNLMAARRAANEGSAVMTLRTIAKSYGSNQSNGKQMKCLTLADLAGSQIVNPGLADGEYNGYRYAVTDFPAGGCEITATPLTESHGSRSFYYSTVDGEVRGATKKGALATRNDPRIN